MFFVQKCETYFFIKLEWSPGKWRWSEDINNQFAVFNRCGPRDITNIKENFQTSKHPPSFDEMSEIGPAYSCGVFGNTSCQTTFGDLMRHMNVIGEGVLQSHPEALEDFLINPSYILPMKRLVNILGEKVKAVAEGTNKNPGDFYSDLQIAFNSPHLTSAQKDKMIWNFIKVYSSQGPSLSLISVSSFATDSQCGVVNLYAGSLVASMLSYLDFATTKQGKPYSLPIGVTTHCDYARPYHFWEAAALAHELKLDGHSDSDVFLAVHKSEVIYEQFGSYQSKSPTKKDPTYVVNAEFHCAYCVETQKNIVFNDAGALWGIRNSNKKANSIDIDSLMLKIYNASGSSNSSGTQNSMQNILAQMASHAINVSPDSIFNWNIKIVPDAAYEELVPNL